MLKTITAKKTESHLAKIFWCRAYLKLEKPQIPISNQNQKFKKISHQTNPIKIYNRIMLSPKSLPFFKNRMFLDKIFNLLNQGTIIQLILKMVLSPTINCLALKRLQSNPPIMNSRVLPERQKKLYKINLLNKFSTKKPRLILSMILEKT